MTSTPMLSKSSLASLDDLRAEKLHPWHRERLAVVSVRPSTVQEVLDHQESTRLHYGLASRAQALGWAAERVRVIDEDLGRSGASAAGRAGFSGLVADVGLGRAGIILALEVSRLARNSTDWHRLIELCALTNTLILDEDGVYDPGQFNDRLLLGLKGTMSEAELHILRSRMRGGILNKARRGELAIPLPAGDMKLSQNADIDEIFDVRSRFWGAKTNCSLLAGRGSCDRDHPAPSLPLPAECGLIAEAPRQ